MFPTKLILLGVVALLIFTDVLAKHQYEIQPRIVRGHDAVRGQFPYYVFLEIESPHGENICGGSLISNQWIISAGHCLENATAIQVHLGSLRANDTKEIGRKIVNVTANDLNRHPKNTQLFHFNDIGLIKLPSPVDFTATIQPIPLACSSQSDTDVIAVGNGLTRSTNINNPPILLYTHLRTVGMFKCLRTFPFLIFRTSVICAEGNEKNSICFGDSGGGLSTVDTNKLVGITSFVKGMGCEEGFPQGFTRVSAHLEWIKEITSIGCRN